MGIGAPTAMPRACSLAAQAAGEDPAGWAIYGRRFLLVEVPLPWPSEIVWAAGLPPGLRELLSELPDTHDPFFEAIVPDPDTLVAGRTRVILFDRPAQAAATFGRNEHVVPTAEVTDIVREWIQGGAPPSLSPTRDEVRDIVVCTHGSHDSCCGRLGAPVYRQLRESVASARVRVWRGSHTGGHRFAPTLLDLPSGRSWARLEPAHLAGLVHRDGEASSLRGRYRGWAMLPTYYERLVEAELLFAHGWSWLDRAVAGSVVEGHAFVFPEDEDELDDQAVVQIAASGTNGGPPETWEAVVRRGRDTLTRGECGEAPWEAPTYQVSKLRLADAHAGQRG